MASIPEIPEPPYCAMIFRSRRASGDDEAYARMAERMVERASGMPGYLGHDSVRGADGVGVTVSYWSSLESIAAWRDDPEHREAQRVGRNRWYEEYSVQVARVERAYGV